MTGVMQYLDVTQYSLSALLRMKKICKMLKFIRKLQISVHFYCMVEKKATINQEKWSNRSSWLYLLP